MRGAQKVAVIRDFVPNGPSQTAQHDRAVSACRTACEDPHGTGEFAALATDRLALQEPDGTLWFAAFVGDNWTSASLFVRSDDGRSLVPRMVGPRVDALRREGSNAGGGSSRRRGGRLGRWVTRRRS